MSKKEKNIELTKTNIENLLLNYEKLKASTYKNIKPGDRLRYFVDKEFRYGGTVKLNKYPNYIVLINPRLKTSWCLQLKQPKLIIYQLTLEKVQKENKLKNEIYKKYLEGKIK